MPYNLQRVLALLVVLCAMPVLLILIVLVWIKLGKPVFFTQIRPGIRGTSFRMVKFRSMRDACGPDGTPLPDSERLTRFGRFLRASSLDELPELINVIRGEIALVGPRPLLMQYLPLYSPEQARRHDVLPGITGWAQVNGRNAISWEEKFALDVWYVEHRSFWLDARILLKTIVKIVQREGITANNQATMTAFTGASSVTHRTDSSS